MNSRSSNLNLPKGISFVGRLYFRATTLISKEIKSFPTKKEGRILSGSNQSDYCVAADTDDVNVQQIPGYSGQSIAAAYVSCCSIACPTEHLPWMGSWMNHEIYQSPTHGAMR